MSVFLGIDGLLLESDLNAVLAEISRLPPIDHCATKDEIDPARTPELTKLLLSMNSRSFVGKVREATKISDLTLGTSYLGRYKPGTSPWKSKVQGGRFGRFPVEVELILYGRGRLETKVEDNVEGIEFVPNRLLVTVRETGAAFRRAVSEPTASALVEYASRSWMPKSLPGTRQGLLMDATLGF